MDMSLCDHMFAFCRTAQTLFRVQGTSMQLKDTLPVDRTADVPHDAQQASSSSLIHSGS